MFLLSYLLLCLFGQTAGADRSDVSTQHVLIQKLLTNYSHDARPTTDNHAATVLKFGVRLVRIVQVVEKEKYIKSQWWIRQNWKDRDLTWDPVHHEGIRIVHVDATSVWVPDTLLYNNADSDRGGMEKSRSKVSVTFDGNVTWNTPAQFWSICDLDVTFFPFDDQVCYLTFGSWAYDVSQLDIVLADKDNAVLDDFYHENGEWILRKSTIERELKKYDCCPHGFSNVLITLNMRRRYYYYIVNLVMPCALIACMIFLSFVLPPESGERISLSVTVLMAMAVFQELTSQQLPPSSERLALLEIYFTTSIFEIGVAICLTCIVLNLHHKRTVAPKWICRLFFDKLAPLVFVTVDKKYLHCMQDQKEVKKENPGPELEESCSCKCVQSKRPNLHVNIDELEMYEYNIKDEESSNQNGNIPGNDKGQEEATSLLDEMVDECNKDPEDLDESQMNRLEYFQEIQKNKRQWKLIAHILDRVLLSIAIFLGVISFMVIFIQAPRVREMLMFWQDPEND